MQENVTQLLSRSATQTVHDPLLIRKFKVLLGGPARRLNGSWNASLIKSQKARKGKRSSGKSVIMYG